MLVNKKIKDNNQDIAQRLNENINRFKSSQLSYLYTEDFY